MSKDMLTGNIEQSPEASRRRTGVKHLNKRPMLAILLFGTTLLMVAGYALKTMSDRQNRTVEAAADDYEAVVSSNFVDSYLSTRSDGVIQQPAAAPPAFLREDPNAEPEPEPVVLKNADDTPFTMASFDQTAVPAAPPVEIKPEIQPCGTPKQCEHEAKLFEAIAAEKVRAAQLKRSPLEDAVSGTIRVNFNRTGSPKMGLPEESESDTSTDGNSGVTSDTPTLIEARGSKNLNSMLELISQRVNAAAGLGTPGGGAGGGSNTGVSLSGVSPSAIGSLLGGIGNSSPDLGDVMIPSGVANLPRQNEFLNEDNDSVYLEQELLDPRSDIELKAGTLIQASLLTAINSELPGQVIAQVTRNVWDTKDSEYVLIPQGTRLIGRYDSGISYGQNRVLVAWDRLIYPNGQSLRLEGMLGVDRAGQSGFRDKVNNHYLRTFGSVVLFSVVAASVAKVDDQDRNRNNIFSTESEFKIALGKQITQLSNKYLDRALNLSPTLTIRQGYVMNVLLDRDIVLPPYADMHRQLSKRYLRKPEQ